MVMDFGAIPPDVTSALMYSGAGSGPLMAAAASWSNLAAELGTAASQWESIVTTLTTEHWTGVGSTAATASAESVVSWLTTAAAAAEHAGAQATASAAAYEAAFSATVPPPVIAANRAQLTALVATNFLGINTAAIMATEAQYAEMWVQDATTMYTYQAASTAAGVLQPTAPETPATNPAAAGIQAATTAQSAAAAPAQGGLGSAISGLQTGFSELQSSLNSILTLNGQIPSIADFASIPVVQNVIYNIGVTAAWNVAMITATFPLLGHFLAGAPLGVTVDDVTPLGAGLGIGTSLVGSTTPLGLGGAVSAGLGEASAVGGLSVPAGWSAAAPATLASSTAPLEGSGWTVASEAAEPVTAMPGMPGMAAAAKGAGAYGAGPRYGFKPIVMPKQVVV
ncbi:PPE family protein [Mycobacterium helveticum]|uniref:PPE family protein n=2 Tax=Mycobacterium helveticum TaxID=2592811 RepID=A0A557XT84_9MYCO|nr:PPE family protein [Mycobacterium helveticum]TVS89858.1 PPE family protein [Mycobacterium helveticum]